MKERNKRGVKCRQALLMIAATCFLGVGSAVAQDTLENVIKESGFNWMIGRWTATNDEGQPVELSYRWAVDKHAVRVNFAMGEYKYEGLIFYVPHEEKVVEIGADNLGGSSKATWKPEGDQLVSKRDGVQADGEKRSMAIYHSKAAAKTMKVALHGVETTGEVAAEPRGTMEFKRQPRQPRQKKAEASTNASE